MQEEWKKALGTMTYGIYGLTTFYKDEINAMIASWVSQVSYDPLLIMAAVHQNRFSHRLIEQSDCFALHALTRSASGFSAALQGIRFEGKIHRTSMAPGHNRVSGSQRLPGIF